MKTVTLPPPPPPPEGLSPSQAQAWELILPQLTVEAYDAPEGDPKVVFLSGDAGTGKTWLASKMLDAANQWWADLMAAEIGDNAGEIDEFKNDEDIIWGDMN